MDTPTTPIENHESPGSDTQPNKRRRKKSIVWEHFTVENVSDGCTRACCKQCKKSFAYITGSKLAGTSHLKRHIALGICPVSRQKNQLTTYTPGSKTGGAGGVTDPPKRRYRGTPGFASIPFDQDRSNYHLVKMIIQHEYPLNIVEHPGFVDFARSLQPNYHLMSFNTIQGDIVSMYLREKQSLLNVISGNPGRVCITLDLWTSDQTLGYVFVTGHFIDEDWKLHKRILNVVMVTSPDSDEAFSQAVVACLSDWAIENRLFTITLDQSIPNETKIGNLRSFLCIKNPFMLNGQLLVGNCYARLLSRLAQDALGTLNEIVGKVRESVKYVKIYESHEEKFLELKQQLQVPSTKGLFIDDQTKWDTTYHMLVAACELKEVFTCLDTSDPDYKDTPSMDEWRQVETLLTYLKLFLDSANILTGPTYPTANHFFHEAWKIQLELTHSATSQDPFISKLTRSLQEKFEKYWRESCMVLAIAVVMDPRFKMKLVEFSFSKVYGDEAETWVNLIDDGIHELFLEYAVPALLPPPSTYTEEGNNGVIKMEMPHEEEQIHHEGGISLEEDGRLVFTTDGLSDFDVYISEISTSQHTKSELDQYLEESLLPREPDFDILGWWKLNKLKYPKLSRMASDILSIPVSTVSAGSVFDTESKKMSEYRTSLPPVVLEALICDKDWLQCGSSSLETPLDDIVLYPNANANANNANLKMEC